MVLLTELKTFDLGCLIVNTAYVLSVKKFGIFLYKCVVVCPMTSLPTRGNNHAVDPGGQNNSH